MHWTRRTSIAGLVLLAASSAQATDVRTLAQLLQPAFLAMNLASACVASPGWKAAQPRGERGSAFDYGFHVKAEVTEGLTEAEQLTVLKTAADRAREEALRQTRNKVREGDPSLERTRLRLWCDHAVTAHVEAFMKEHDEHHRVFHEQVTQAKQANGI